MKATRLKISVSQDGLLPEETAEVATIPLPILPKKLLKALGFERVDSTTYVGVLPVFVNLGDKEQEIEIELGVTLPDMRKKIIEIVKTPSKLSYLKGQAEVVELPTKSNLRSKEEKKPRKKLDKAKKAGKVRQHARRKG
jgi:hypothetical protein